MARGWRSEAFALPIFGIFRPENRSSRKSPITSHALPPAGSPITGEPSLSASYLVCSSRTVTEYGAKL
jgi:hypothetical protein